MNPLILSRFTYDTETLDITLTTNMTMLFTSVGWLLTGIILQTVILPWQIVMISFIMLIYYLLVLHYRKSATDLQRLDATSRAPAQAQLSEAWRQWRSMAASNGDSSSSPWSWPRSFAEAKPAGETLTRAN